MKGNTSEMTAAMHRLQTLSFALQEALLYLDGHPDSTAAGRYYDKASAAYRAAVQDYEMKYGPLSVAGGTAAKTDGGWLWVEGPWPWETTFPGNATPKGEEE